MNGTTKDSFIPAEANKIHISKLKHQREEQTPSFHQLTQRDRNERRIFCHQYDWPMVEFLIMGENDIAKKCYTENYFSFLFISIQHMHL